MLFQIVYLNLINLFSKRHTSEFFNEKKPTVTTTLVAYKRILL